jgi:hypothetical protein
MTIINKQLLMGVVVFLGCRKEQPTEPTRTLTGRYISTTFVPSGPAYKPVDVQAAGGSVHMTLPMIISLLEQSIYREVFSPFTKRIVQLLIADSQAHRSMCGHDHSASGVSFLTPFEALA